MKRALFSPLLLLLAFMPIAGAGPEVEFDYEEDYEANHRRGAPRGGGDEFPKVVDPAMVDAAEADRLIPPQEWVIGVSIGEEHQAFPIVFMGRPELVNVRCGGTPVTITWCVNCQTAIVFRREVAGRVLTFFAEGTLYRGGLCLYDEETGTIWSQALARAVQGPLKGAELDYIPSTLTTWASWKRRYPETKVFAGVPGLDPVRGVFLIEERGPASYAFGLASRGALKEQGARGTARIYAYDILQKRRVINDFFLEEPIVVVLDPELGSARGWRAKVDGQACKFFVKTGAAGDGALLMLDDLSMSIWSAAEGRCIEGPLEGARLEALIGYTWYLEGWKDFYPQAGLYEDREGR